MAMHVLEKQRPAGMTLSAALANAVEHVGRCSRCRILTEEPTCNICLSAKRQEGVLCVVENPSDVFAIEQSGEFKGRYFVLMGHLSPIDGIGPDDIGVTDLLARIADEAVEEVILATSTTVEGEATAFYIADQLAPQNITVSRIAHGVPLGGELEFVDGGTIARALSGRSRF
jgi:recombination protein RecR